MKRAIISFLTMALVVIVCCASAHARTVIVKEGDDFWKLHLRYQVSWEGIQEANRDRLVEADNFDLLIPGQELVIPEDEEAASLEEKTSTVYDDGDARNSRSEQAAETPAVTSIEQVTTSAATSQTQPAVAAVQAPVVKPVLNVDAAALQNKAAERRSSLDWIKSAKLQFEQANLDLDSMRTSFKERLRGSKLFLGLACLSLMTLIMSALTAISFIAKRIKILLLAYKSLFVFKSVKRGDFVCIDYFMRVYCRADTLEEFAKRLASSQSSLQLAQLRYFMIWRFHFSYEMLPDEVQWRLRVELDSICLGQEEVEVCFRRDKIHGEPESFEQIKDNPAEQMSPSPSSQPIAENDLYCFLWHLGLVDQ